MIRQVSIRTLMIAIAVCGLFCWPLGVVAKRAIEAQSEARCSANLVEIGAAMAQYEAKYGHLPPAYVTDPNGTPAHSWRVLLLEFLDPALFRQYNFAEPWDGPNNSQLASKMPRVYACPSHDGAASTKISSYAVIVDAESAFPENRFVRIVDIADRTLNIPTILVAEASNSNIPWMEPRDVRIDLTECDWNDDLHRSGVSSPHRKGAGLLCFGGQVRRVKPTLPMNTLKNMITISGYECYCDNPY